MWNARGAGNEECKANLKEVKKFYTPRIVIVVETRQNEEESCKIIKELGFSGFYVVGARAFSGGIWFLWDDDMVNISGAVQSYQAVHAVITMKQANEPWMLSAVYADPNKQKRKCLWKEFEALSHIGDVGWLAVGDFNTIKDVEEKRGGRPPSVAQLQELS
ncbi:Endonuclease/exonuclease/phosphatase [Thalictrum thalictroides]|uniref:Endonuclease/exonuclease/phosphatase n=1 Tax=Thalictrum thalictroides TaxID=46969 RepID=A0A7J6V281_THATH|nr:Endonuclease/exonuclease/phosphatase [Thalictrum thalictroides]